MKVQNITDIEGFFKVVDSCEGRVELVTGDYLSMYLWQISSLTEEFRNWKSLLMSHRISINL